MEAGRELDALVAEKVMGLSHKEMWGINDYREDGSPVLVPDFPPYSDDIAAAWGIMEKLRWAEPEVSWSDEQHCWHAIIWKGRNSGQVSAADTAPHAICLAALKAIEAI